MTADQASTGLGLVDGGGRCNSESGDLEEEHDKRMSFYQELPNGVLVSGIARSGVGILVAAVNQSTDQPSVISSRSAFRCCDFQRVDSSLMEDCQSQVPNRGYCSTPVCGFSYGMYHT